MKIQIVVGDSVALAIGILDVIGWKFILLLVI